MRHITDILEFKANRRDKVSFPRSNNKDELTDMFRKLGFVEIEDSEDLLYQTLIRKMLENKSKGSFCAGQENWFRFKFPMEDKIWFCYTGSSSDRLYTQSFGVTRYIMNDDSLKETSGKDFGSYDKLVREAEKYL